MKKIILALLILIMAATVAAADTIYLRDGRTIRGTVLGFISGRFAVRVTSTGVGALIGVIRTPGGQVSQPFNIGSQRTITAPEDGRLILLVNDDDYRDNTGSFNVRVSY